MRKLLVGACLLLFILSNTGIGNADSHETVIQTETPVGVDSTSSQSAVVVARVNYELPYPGMLPDNPFYFLKAIRDKMVKMLINDDMVMARFSLNNAEKRIFAGQLLLEQKKDEHAIDSVSKGVNYYDETLAALEKVLRDEPKHIDIEPFLQKTKTSLSKSQEVVGDMGNGKNNQYKNALAQEEKRMVKITQKVETMLKKK